RGFGHETSRQIPPARRARRRAGGCASWCLSIVSPIAPDIAWIDTLRCLVLASVRIARRRGLIARITAVRSVLAVILCRWGPRVPRRRKVAAVVVIIVVGWALLGADAVAEWTRRNAVIAAARGISVLPPDQLILGVLDLAVAVDAEAFGDHPPPRALHVAGLEVDRFACQMAFGLGRRRGEGGLRGDIGPHGLDDRLEDRHSDVATGRAAPEGAVLAGGVVVADPNRGGDVVGETDEPGVVLLIGGAGLARDIRGEAGDRARRAPRQHALQHGLELIEGGAVDRGDHDRRFRVMAIDHDAIALDGVDHMRGRVQAFIRDRRVECREIDRPHRLRPEHEWIIVHAVTIDLRFHRKLAEAIEARFRRALDAALEQMDGGEIARILERPAQGGNASVASVVVLRRPVIALAGAPAAQRG